MPNFDPNGPIRTLTEHGVRFVVIGGVAGTLLGTTRVTQDLDIMVDYSKDNLERLTAALRQLGARMSVSPDDAAETEITTGLLEAHDHMGWLTEHGRLDTCRTVAGAVPADQVIAAAETVELGGSEVRVVNIETLIEMKGAAGRPKDLDDLAELFKLRELADQPEA